MGGAKCGIGARQATGGERTLLKVMIFSRVFSASKSCAPVFAPASGCSCPAANCAVLMISRASSYEDSEWMNEIEGSLEG